MATVQSYTSTKIDELISEAWLKSKALTIADDIYNLPPGYSRVPTSAVATEFGLPYPGPGVLLSIPNASASSLIWRPNRRDNPPEVYVSHQLTSTTWSPFFKESISTLDLLPYALRSEVMPDFGKMAAGTDLNDLKTDGFWSSPSSVGEILTIVNRPPGDHPSGGLFRQFKVKVTTVNTVTFQEVNAWIDGGTIKQFRRTGLGSVFSPWEELRLASPLSDATEMQILRSVIGSSDKVGNLKKLREGILNPTQRTIVAAVGVSHFRPQGGTPIGPIERIAFAAGSPTVPSLDGLTSRPAGGMLWFNGSQGGTESVDYLPEARLVKLDLADPDYVIHGIGANDYSRNVPPLTFKNNVRNMLERIETDTPGVVNVLVHLQNRSDATVPDYPWSEYGKALEELAEENTTREFVDANSPLDAFRLHRRNSAFGLQLPDNIHLTGNGVKMLARVLSDALGIPATPNVGVESHDELLPNSTTYVADSALGSILLPPVVYPRLITVRVRLGYQFTGTDPASLTSSLNDAFSESYLVSGGQSSTVEMTETHYLEPNREAECVVNLKVNSGGSVYVLDSPSSSLFQVTEQPY